MHLAILENPLPPIGLMANTGGGIMLYRTRLPELMLSSEQLYLVDNVCYYLENMYTTLPTKLKSKTFVLALLNQRLDEFDALIE